MERLEAWDIAKYKKHIRKRSEWTKKCRLDEQSKNTALV